MGIVRQPRSPAIEDRKRPDCYRDATASDRLCRHSQPKAPTIRTSFPKSLQIDSLSGIDFETLMERASVFMGIKPKEFLGPGKQRKKVQARSLLCWYANGELRISQAELSMRLGITPASISVAVQRGRQIAEDYGYTIEKIFTF